MKIIVLTALCCAALAGAPRPASVVDAEEFHRYVEEFNAIPTPDVESLIPDKDAWAWMEKNVPIFTCPDPAVERTYYYRWWSFRKHIRQTSDGFILTEFLRPVGHATDHNAISCALGHHIAEGRWLRNPRYLDDYVRFWLTSGKDGGLQRHYHKYSNWTAYALYDRWLADERKDFLVSLLDPLILDYRTWEEERQLASGLFWQYDVRDGMEESVSGSRTAKNARPTINSYMYGNAVAVANIARLAGRQAVAEEFEKKARRLKELVEKQLWDRKARFFKSLLESGGLADVRELIGYTSWYFLLPTEGRGYEEAWKQLMDDRGFHAPYGPTTAEQRHPGFQIAEAGDDCQWNGPSWPFSTAVTLKALANVLNRYRQDAISVDDFFETFLIYTKSHRRQLPGGKEVAWIDENLNPFTGEWHARQMKIRKGKFDGRGDHYNHSSYCDLLITGVAGLRPRADDVVEVRPLVPPDTWSWFCLDRVPYHGRMLTIIWDKDGRKFGKGAGLRVFCDGRQIARSARLERVTGSLNKQH